MKDFYSLKDILDSPDFPFEWKRFSLKYGTSILRSLERIFVCDTYRYPSCAVLSLKKKGDALAFDVFLARIVHVPYKPFDFMVCPVKVNTSLDFEYTHSQGVGPEWKFTNEELKKNYKALLVGSSVFLPLLFHERAHIYGLDYPKLLKKVPRDKQRLFLRPPMEFVTVMSFSEFYGALADAFEVKREIIRKLEVEKGGAYLRRREVIKIFKNLLTISFLLEEAEKTLQVYSSEALEELWQRFNSFWEFLLRSYSKKGFREEQKALLATNFLPAFIRLVKLQFMVERILPNVVRLQRKLVDFFIPEGIVGLRKLQEKLLDSATESTGLEKFWSEFSGREISVYKINEIFQKLVAGFLYLRYVSLIPAGFLPEPRDMYRLNVLEEMLSDYPDDLRNELKKLREATSREKMNTEIENFCLSSVPFGKYASILESLRISFEILTECSLKSSDSPFTEWWALELANVLRRNKVSTQDAENIFYSKAISVLVPQLALDSVLWRDGSYVFDRYVECEDSSRGIVIDSETFHRKIKSCAFHELIQQRVARNVLDRMDNILSGLSLCGELDDEKFKRLEMLFSEMFESFEKVYGESSRGKDIRVAETALELDGKRISLLSVVNVLVWNFARLHFLKPFEKDVYSEIPLEEVKKFATGEPYCRTSLFHGLSPAPGKGLSAAISSSRFRKAGKKRTRKKGQIFQNVEFVKTSWKMDDLFFNVKNDSEFLKQLKTIALHNKGKFFMSYDESGRMSLTYSLLVQVKAIDGKSVMSSSSVVLFLSRRLEEEVLIRNNPVVSYLFQFSQESSPEDFRQMDKNDLEVGQVEETGEASEQIICL